MKRLTPEEFAALGQGPHDARVVGVPDKMTDVMAWDGDEWTRVSLEFVSSAGVMWDQLYSSCGPCSFESKIWHKLPADYVDAS